jgi:hypothetical protein
MKHEDPFDAHALENPADGDRLVQAAVTLGDHHTLVGLDTFLVAFTDAHANAHGVTDVNLRKLALELLALPRHLLHPHLLVNGA